MADDNRILIDELEKRLIWYRDEASVEEFDADAVDAICTMLQKLSPAEEPHRTKEEAYENILKQIQMEEEIGENAGAVKDEEGGEAVKASHFRMRAKGLRAAVVALVVVGIFVSLNTVAYAKENKSLFTMLLERVGWLEIEKEPGEGEGIVEVERATGEFYNSWADLEQEVKERVVVPGYIPEGYSLYGIRSWDFTDRKSIQSDYYNQENGHILIEITLWKENADHYRENIADESDYMLLSEYSDEDTLYYVYEDEYICIAFLENSFYRISGNVSLKDIVKIGECLGNI